MSKFKKSKIFFKFLTFFMLGFFSLGFSEALAQSIGGNEGSCRMTVLSMEANPTIIDTKTSVNFHTKVDRKGCAETLDIKFEFYIDGRLTKTCIDKPPHLNTIEFNCPYNFSQYQYWDSVNLPGTLPYYLIIFSSQGHSYANTSSWGKKFTVVKGTLGESFTFIVEPPNPVMGGNLTIKYQDFPPGATGKIFVNDDNHFVNIFAGGNSIVINSQNGFKAGANALRFVLYNSSGSKIFDQTYTASVATQSTQLAVAFDKQQVVLGGVVNVTVSNPPAGFRGSYRVNTSTITTPFSSISFPINVTKDKGFNETGSNTIYFSIVDASGKSTEVTKTISTTLMGQPGGQPGQPGAQPGVDSKLNEFLFNPLPTDNLTGTLLTIAKGFLGIVALWAVVFIIIGGFKLIMAQGQEENYLAAKKTITWAILGLVVAMLSFSIIAIVQNLLQVKIPAPPEDGPVINKTK